MVPQNQTEKSIQKDCLSYLEKAGGEYYLIYSLSNLIQILK